MSERRVQAMPDTHTAPLPAPQAARDEAHRLAALRRLRLLDTPRELAFDRLARLAARVAGTPMAAVALLDRERNWFKAQIGLPVSEVPRAHAPCTFTVQEGSLLVIPDVAAETRFDLSAMTAAHRVGFYAGAPVRSPDGACVGTLCVLAPAPRTDFGRDDRANLRDIASLVEDEIARRADAQAVRGPERCRAGDDVRR
jgi:GAF domain-containing protein